MFKVLAHHWCKAPILSPLPATFYIFLFAFFPIIFIPLTSGQEIVNGQLFTKGLSIVNAPAPQSEYHFGSNITIVIDVSGNGQLENSGQNGYDGLDLYLVSAQTNTNITVSNNSDILNQEPGGTVKHLNWQIPGCISSGQYNLTLYECSRVNGRFSYTITPILIEIDNPNASGVCTASANPLYDQPQASSPPQQSPFLPPIGQPYSWQSSTSTTGFVASYTSLSNGQTVTVTEPPTPTTVTVVKVSVAILTSTKPGQTSIFTTTQTSSMTTTAIMIGPSTPSGFLPVNVGTSDHSISLLWLYLLITMTLAASC